MGKYNGGTYTSPPAPGEEKDFENGMAELALSVTPKGQNELNRGSFSSTAGYSQVDVSRVSQAMAYWASVQRAHECSDPMKISSCYEREGSDECDDGRQHQTLDGEA